MALVNLSVEAAVATITLDSPQNRNALSAALMDELDAHLTAVAGDDAVRAVVLTHTGPTFCAGADLREAADGGMERGTVRLLGLLRKIIELPVPVLAHLRGNARAGGLGLVGAADLAVAPAATSFAFSEVRLGLAPAIISLTTLPRLDPRAASRYFLTGEEFDGAEAERIGLLTMTGDGVEGADAAAAHLLSGLRLASRQGLTATKGLLNAALAERVAADGDAVVRLSATLFGSEEAAEGMAAFKERRPPRWVEATKG
ncbi:enoyl-CoA hydratase family protein [Yinghuangia seranimata]|uniref:enoyl-CoA hydratase family protein n=1 Tax=Yinghuangia seranimata TaxID=408067 RepID=UPI00248C8E44|nr:enoyl-CoA hydratase family protein [Yinghuangia seranimata]MDI2129986.1 enoyl-CoA hydratase family protein [Yinghuangia seranimata]